MFLYKATKLYREDEGEVAARHPTVFYGLPLISLTNELYTPMVKSTKKTYKKFYLNFI